MREIRARRFLSHFRNIYERHIIFKITADEGNYFEFPNFQVAAKGIFFRELRKHISYSLEKILMEKQTRLTSELKTLMVLFS